MDWPAPMGMCLPETLRPADTSTYIQGVEVDKNLSGEVPEGSEVMDLPPGTSSSPTAGENGQARVESPGS